MSIRDRIREFILHELEGNSAEIDLTDNYPLLETEMIDSLAVFSLVSFLEEELDIEIPEEDLVIDNFVSIQAIARMAEARLQKTDSTG